MKMKRLSFFCLLLLAVGLMKAQTKQILKFAIEAPDTVTQGESFNVDYVLHATNYSNYESPDFKGCRVLNRYFPTGTVVVNNRKYHKLECNYRLVTSKTGLLKLPPQSLVVGKKKEYSTTKTIYVKPNPQYGKELELATQFLCDKGCAPDSCVLILKQQTAEYILFADDNGRQFVVIAKAAYFPYIENPILAWGRESTVQDLKNSTLQGLLSNYGKQLRQLAKLPTKLPVLALSSYKPAHTAVAPLLNKIAWGQGSPYNSFCPQVSDVEPEKNALVGCVPVSMAQIMGYYKYPLRGRGAYAYTQDDVLYTLNLHLQTFDWSKMKDTYQKTENDTVSLVPLARLMATASVSVAAMFGEKNTSANIYNVKTALVNFFGYSATCCSVRDVSDDTMLGLLFRELDARRPVILSGASHAFVCDGYDGDFLHFNMGWEGYSNGYYRVMLMPGINEKQLMFGSMVIGIEPEKKLLSKVVEVEAPGKLRSMFTEEERCSVNRLVVRGKINAADVAFLRRMAGAVDDKDYFSWRGALKMLDLSHARLVEGNTFYLRLDAKEMGYTAYSYNHYSRHNYDFRRMDEKSWKNFCRDGLDKGRGYRFISVGEKYYIDYLIEKNVIGEYMFSNCDNLQIILLPESTKLIGKGAFIHCSSLDRMSLPETVTSVGDYAFAYTRLLSKVTCKVFPEEGKELFKGGCSFGKGIVYE